MHIDFPDDVLARLDAWAAKRNMTRPEAARHLIVTGMDIGDAVRTLNSVGRTTVESMFPEAEGDLEEAWVLVECEQTDSLGSVTTHEDRPYSLTIDAVLVRGKWIVSVERYEGGDWENAERTAVTVHEDRAAAVDRFSELLVDLTGELWSEADGLPLWDEGIDGDTIGGEGGIAWRDLIPDGAVMTAAELDAVAAGTLAEYRAAQAAELEAWRREQRTPVDPAILADRRCPYCGSTGLVVSGRPVPHVCEDTHRHVPEAEMNPKHYA